ncbi:MAG: response regulator, partial [Chloroflexota bacterium]|nr:response regulator [Chloroflexota bacterium]
MAAAAVETRNPLVLIVEDDPDIQLLVSTSLERGGYTVRTASDGREALSSINDTIPDLIISDVMMPELDGLELLSILRNDPATRRVPVILLTAKGSTSDIVTGFDLGADDYLPKPFVVRELQARVRAKVERPPVPIDEVVRERHLTILPLQSFETELAREIMRTRRGGGIGSLAVLEIAELGRIRERLGGRAEAALVRQVGTAIAEDGRALDSTGRDKHGRFLLLMPETRTEGAEIRLRRLAQLLVRQAFVVGGESVRLTPVIGYVEYGPGVTSENVLEKAMTALDHAAAHLDLEPVRYQESMGLRESDGRRALAALGRAVALRLPVQVAAVHLLGLVLPFLAYLGLDRIGFNIVPVMYFVVVVSLLITATLIWVEGFHSLQVRNPPEPDSAPPPVTGIIAAYLPNEAATIVDTVESFLRSDYPGDYQVILAYNTPRDLPVEGTLQRIAARDPRFIPMRVENSTSKAQNVNAALAEARGEIIGVFDADHHPAPNAFTRAWKWIASGYDIVQGHCVVRNGVESGVARLVAVEFEAIYAVAHPGRARLHDFGIFGGSNGYWRADLLRQTRMHGFMLTEDIDSSI